MESLGRGVGERGGSNQDVNIIKLDNKKTTNLGRMKERESKRKRVRGKLSTKTAFCYIHPPFGCPLREKNAMVCLMHCFDAANQLLSVPFLLCPTGSKSNQCLLIVDQGCQGYYLHQTFLSLSLSSCFSHNVYLIRSFASLP